MGLVVLKCPACGADIDIDDSREHSFCTYCGANVAFEKNRIELSGSVSVKGLAGTESLLERTLIFLSDGDFDSAAQYAERVLDISPRCAKAYIFRLMAAKRLRQIGDIGCLQSYIGDNADLKRALEFSTGEENAYYQQLAARNREAFGKAAAERNALQNNLSQSLNRFTIAKIISILLIVFFGLAFFILTVYNLPTLVLISLLICVISGITLSVCINKEKALKLKLNRINFELEQLSAGKEII